MTPVMRYAGWAAVAGAVAWLAKFVVIWAGNDNEDLHGALQVIGAVGLFLAAGVAAWQAAAARGAGLRVLAVVGAVLVLFLVTGAVEEGLNAAIDADDDSVLEELVLLVIGIPALLLGLAAIGRARQGSPEEPAAI